MVFSFHFIYHSLRIRLDDYLNIHDLNQLFYNHQNIYRLISLMLSYHILLLVQLFCFNKNLYNFQHLLDSCYNLQHLLLLNFNRNLYIFIRLVHNLNKFLTVLLLYFNILMVSLNYLYRYPLNL